MPTITRLLLTAALSVAAFTTLHAQPAKPSLSGNWEGAVGPLDFTFHITDPAGGPRSATLDILAQRAQGMVLQFTAPADSVYLRMSKPVAAQFAGRRSADGQLVGEWQQGLRSFPLTLSRAGDAKPAATLRRPQTPQPPLPYQSADVMFRNEQADISLSGTYTVPADMGPFPAVVLLTGSGAQDRNSTLFNHQPFAVLADYLTRNGVAVLRFDDRGVGGSGGSAKTMTSAQYTTDAQAAVAWLRAQHGIRKNQVGVIGHSQGGTAAVGAAIEANSPDFLVLLAAPGLPGDEMIVQQVLAMARLKSATAAQLATTEKNQRSIFQIVQSTPDNAQARAKILAVLDPQRTGGVQLAAQLEPQLAALTSADYRGMLADRPAQTLAKVQCPVLALAGSKDVQVVAAPNLAATAAALKTGGNRDVTVKELPGLNHLFQTASTGLVEEYKTIEETFSPVALKAIGDWIAQHTQK